MLHSEILRLTRSATSYESVVAQAFSDVADARAAQRGNSALVQEQLEQVKSLRAAGALVLRRYEVGYSSYFEVIDADSSLFTVELQLVQAYRDQMLSPVQLFKALGGGWVTAQGASGM